MRSMVEGPVDASPALEEFHLAPPGPSTASRSPSPFRGGFTLETI